MSARSVLAHGVRLIRGAADISWVPLRRKDNTRDYESPTVLSTGATPMSRGPLVAGLSPIRSTPTKTPAEIRRRMIVCDGCF